MSFRETDEFKSIEGLSGFADKLAPADRSEFYKAIETAYNAGASLGAQALTYGTADDVVGLREYIQGLVKGCRIPEADGEAVTPEQMETLRKEVESLQETLGKKVESLQEGVEKLKRTVDEPLPMNPGPDCTGV